MEYEYYEDVIDAYEAGIGVEEGDSLTDYIRKNNIKIINIEPFRPTESKADGGSVGIEVLFGPKVPAAPSQLVSESDILLGYRGDAAYRSGSEQSKSIGQGNVGSKASFGGGQGRDRSGRSEGAGGAQVSRALEAQRLQNLEAKRLQNIANQNKKNSTIDTMKNVYGIVSPFINPGSNLGKVKTIFDTYNLYKKGPFNEKDMTLGMGDNPLPSENLLADATTTPTGGKLGLNLMDYGTLNNAGYTDAQIEELQNNPNINTEEIIRDIKGPIFAAADGGRVGLFMGGSPLEGEALSIYNSMKAYGNDDQTIADRLQALGMYTPQDSTPDPTPDQGIINQQLNQGGGDGPKGDFGKFGNLLKDTEKTFTKDVYAIDKNMYPGAPMTGSFKPTEITGYQDVTSGLYKTEDGKNINHLGLNIKPGIISLLEKLGFGDLDETQFTGLPYEEGYVAGTFTGKKLSDFFKKQQATNAEIAAANLKAKQELEAKLAAEKAAKEAAIAAEMARYNITSDSDFGGGTPGGGGGNVRTTGGDVYGGSGYI